MGSQYDKASQYKQLSQNEHEYSTIIKLDNLNRNNPNINEDYTENNSTHEIDNDGNIVDKEDQDFDSNSLHSNR